MVNVLVVGSGGREHALAWKIESSNRVSKVYIAPGNGGTRNNLDIKVDDIDGLAKFAKSVSAFTVIGPEIPLAAGIVDEFVSKGLPIFGPTKAAARLESSKSWSKEFMKRNNIPTADYQSFGNANEAVEYAKTFKDKLVIKADGLAAGKGVTVCDNAEHAILEIQRIMENDALGAAGSRVIIEQALVGIEASFIALCDGKTSMAMATSQDHKRVGDGEMGANTGGMGAYSPTPFVTPNITHRVQTDIINTVVYKMAKEGTPFSGFLYAGIMIGKNDEINVLEFNVRMGDPECQPIMMRADFDLYEYLLAASNRKLDTMPPMKWSTEHAACVVLASRNYPGTYPTGQTITGISKDDDNSIVFHAGTRLDGDKLVTNGGRVLGVTARNKTLKGALDMAYARANAIQWEAKFSRTDIGSGALIS